MKLDCASFGSDRDTRTSCSARPLRAQGEQRHRAASCRVTACRELEACLDTSLVVELHVQPNVDEACMRRIAGTDRMEYHPEFPRPLFRLRRRGVWAIQGIVGDPKLRVTYLPGAPPSAFSELRARIECPS